MAGRKRRPAMSEAKPTDRRQFLKDGATAVIGIGLLPFVLRGHLPTSNHQSIHADREMRTMPLRESLDAPNIHNMLIVGHETVFLSHLPMFKTPDFDSPHRYQVILEATLKKDGRDTLPTYANDRKNNPTTTIYTLGPEEFILPNLNSANANPPLSKFKASVFRGHLERRGKKRIIEDADVSIQNVVHFREFDPQAKKLAQLEYILFGKGSELFLAHLITRPPDFDQVLSIKITDHNFTDEELRKGLRVVFGRPNTISRRLLEKQEAVGEVKSSAGEPLKVRVRAVVEYYFESGELRG
jgi:hypothetical protein